MCFFLIQCQVEHATKHKCCVVYGALPPETRTQQAKLFNDPNSGYDVLVASDAVGMGLNLNIRRVVFYSLDKFDGDAKKPVSSSQVWSIGTYLWSDLFNCNCVIGKTDGHI